MLDSDKIGTDSTPLLMSSFAISADKGSRLFTVVSVPVYTLNYKQRVHVATCYTSACQSRMVS